MSGRCGFLFIFYFIFLPGCTSSFFAFVSHEFLFLAPFIKEIGSPVTLLVSENFKSVIFQDRHFLEEKKDNITSKQVRKHREMGQCWVFHCLAAAAAAVESKCVWWDISTDSINLYSLLPWTCCWVWWRTRFRPSHLQTSLQYIYLNNLQVAKSNWKLSVMTFRSQSQNAE